MAGVGRSPPYAAGGSLCILTVPMNNDRRGVLGFTVALASIVTMIIALEVFVTCNFSCKS